MAEIFTSLLSAHGLFFELGWDLLKMQQCN